MIDFKINDVSLDISSKAIYSRNRKEQADSGTVTLLNSNPVRYEPYTRVSINDEQYLIESDHLTEQRAGQYEHQLTLIENIAIFTAIFPVDRSFKRVPALTLGEILTIYRRELEFYQGFFFTYDTTDPIYNTKIVDKEYASQNLAVLVYDLFRSINAIPRLTWNDGWVLSYELYTATSSVLTLNVENRQSSVTDINYATNLLAKTRNAVSEDEGHIYWPSSTTFMTPRAKGTMYKTSDLQYEVDSDAMAIYEITAYIETNLTVTTSLEPTPQTYAINVEVDITDRVKEASVYEALPLSTDNNPNIEALFFGEPSISKQYFKQNCIRWTKESNVIDSLWWKQDGVFLPAAVKALQNAISYNIPEAVYAKYSLTYDLSQDWGLDTLDDTEDIPIRIKYRPRRDIDFVTEKNIVSGLNQSTILNNQKDSSIEIGRYLQNSNAIVNRIGNAVFNLTQTFDTYAEAWKLGDYYLIGNQRWVITDITYIEDKNLVTCDAEFTVNFSNVNRETSITRQPNPYVYTGKGVQSNFIYKEYLIFDKQEIEYFDNSFLNAQAKATALNIIPRLSVDDLPLRHMTYRRLGSSDFIDRQLFGAGSGNVILLHAAFNDARLAGKSFKKINGSWYQDPVWYVNPTTEELEQAAIRLQHTHTLLTDTEDYKHYPKIASGSFDYTDSLVLRFDKDPNDSLAITFEIICVSEDEDVIVGNGFTRFNNLIRELSGTVAVYTDTEPYTIFDVKPKGTLDTNATIILGVNYIEVQDGLGDPIPYWAIVSNDEIVLAGNNSVSKVYYGFTRNRLYGAIVDDSDMTFDIEFIENDLITSTLIMAQNLSLAAVFLDNAVIVSTLILVPEIKFTASFKEYDNISTTLIIIQNSAEPTVTYVNYSYDGVKFYTYNFTVKNNDEVAAEIFASTVSTPTTSRGVIASQSSVAVSVISEDSSVTLYARAKASGENYSTIDSAVGTIL